jgi:putative flippase GtrA
MRMATTNSNWEKQLEEIRRRVNQRQFWQDVGTAQVAPDVRAKNAVEGEDFPLVSFANCCRDNEVRTGAGSVSDSISGNPLPANDLRTAEEAESATEASPKREHLIASSTLVRWSKFNFVGGIGIAVQFAALFLLKTVFHLDYLVATALAVEAAVLHNFVWHERFTWADRTKLDRIKPDRIRPDRIKPERTKPDRVTSDRAMREGTQPCGRCSLARLVRFHLGNGAVSILGNLVLMKLLVGQGHMNYLVANAIAIALCSLANFLVSDEWVFGE